VIKIVILGGEGNGGVFASCIEKNITSFPDNHSVEICGYLNDFLNPGEFIDRYPVLGPLQKAKEMATNEEYNFVWAVHPIGEGRKRQQIYHDLQIPYEKFFTYVSPMASISKSAKINHGAFIMDNCYVGPRANVGENSFVMANSVVGHDTNIGKFCHVSAGANISSYVNIGDFSDICIGATILEKKKIGNFAVAGAGSIIVKDIGDNEVHFGNPGRFMRNSSKT
tara:strand:- start:6118 stop:6789 length:672 start_codon:yes stop_codon:yes gene_type:complete